MRKNKSSRATAIMEWLRAHGPATDRQVAAGMGVSIPYVQPYISRLKKQGLLRFVDKVIDDNTRRLVRRTQP